MGVHGLWQLIQSTGKPVSLESLEGKVLAIDVSVWLHQLSKGMRDKDGKPVVNAHLHGLFTRICKLLFYKIKPVFVFDGGVPVLKKETLAGRRRKREEAEEASGRATQKLLTNLIRSQAVKQALGEDTPVSIPSIPSKSKDTLFQLPPLSEDSQRYIEDGTEEEDFWEERMGYHQYIENEYQGLDSVDVESEEFLSLPPEIQHEIITDIRLRRKNYNMSRIGDLPQDSTDFSQFQVKKLLKHSKLSCRLTEVEKEMNQQLAAKLTQNCSQDAFPGEVQARRIVSDDTTHYVLVKGLQKSKQEEIARIKKELNIDEPSTSEMDELFLEAENKSELKIKSFVKQEKVDEKNNNFLTGVDQHNVDGCRSVHEADDNILFSNGSYDPYLKLKQVRECDQIVPSANGSVSAKVPVATYSHIDRSSGSKRIFVSDAEDDVNIVAHKTDWMRRHVGDDKAAVSTSVPSSSISQQYSEAINRETSSSVQDPVFSKNSQDDFIEVKIDPNNIKEDELFPIEVFVTAEELGVIREPIKDDFTCFQKEGTNVKQNDVGQITDSAKVTVSEETSYSEEKYEAFNTDNKVGGIKDISDDPVRVHIIHSSEDQDEEMIDVDPSENMEENDKGEEKGEINEDDRQEESEVGSECSHDDDDDYDDDDDDDYDDDDDGRVVDNPISVMDLLNLGGKKQEDTSDIQYEDTSDIQYEGTSGIQYEGTSGIQYEDTSGIQYEDTSGIQYEDTSGIQYEDFSKEDIIDRVIVSDIAKEFQNMTQVDLQGIRDELQEEASTLETEMGKQQRLATSISDQMHTEAQELLRLFGVPYIVSPSEAEAQCAQLDLFGLVHGTITDDSDIWLFGGKRVYKNFFNQQKFVEMFRMESIESGLGLSRDALINIALLCGSDYTEGIQKVGPVTAMEILAEFPGQGIAGLHTIRTWWEEAQQQIKVPKETPLKSKLRNLELPPGFPSEVVVDAYVNPTVDDSTEPFSWSRPDLFLLREFAMSKLGWNKDKTDEVLVPVMKKLAEKTTQGKISSYFTPENFIEPAKMKSKRLQIVVNKFVNPVTTAEEADLKAYPDTVTKAKEVMKARLLQVCEGQGSSGIMGKKSVIRDEVDMSEDSSNGEGGIDQGRTGQKRINKGKQPLGKGRQFKGKGKQSETLKGKPEASQSMEDGFFWEGNSTEDVTDVNNQKTLSPGKRATDFLLMAVRPVSVVNHDTGTTNTKFKQSTETKPSSGEEKKNAESKKASGSRIGVNAKKGHLGKRKLTVQSLSKPTALKKSKSSKPVRTGRLGVCNLSESDSDSSS